MKQSSWTLTSCGFQSLPTRVNRREPLLPWQMPEALRKKIRTLPRASRRFCESPSYRRADADLDFLARDGVRGVRLQIDYLKPELLLEEHRIRHTIVVFGSTRICEPAAAQRKVDTLKAALAADTGNKDLARRLAVAERILAKSQYYDVAREFGRLVSATHQTANGQQRVVVTGGGPGIMEAANRGAFDVGAESVGLNISLPHEQYPNPYITPDLCFNFHYFAMRKLHFLLRAKALVAFPGGLWHLRRTVRGAHARPDAQDQADAGRPGRRELLAPRRQSGFPGRRRRHRPGRSRTVLVCRNGPGDLEWHLALVRYQRRALHVA